MLLLAILVLLFLSIIFDHLNGRLELCVSGIQLSPLCYPAQGQSKRDRFEGSGVW